MKKNSIDIYKAEMHNLKSVNVSLPKNALIVCTGVSGSGKSSLCMDTIYAEGQRRYIESLSSYARQFLERINKPKVEKITNLCPAIAINQHNGGKSSRATVGTATEIYDYLRLLYARVGKTYHPKTGELVTKHQTDNVFDALMKYPDGQRIAIAFPYSFVDDVEQEIALLRQKGYVRIIVDSAVHLLDDAITIPPAVKSISVIVDRLKCGSGIGKNKSRWNDSIDQAFQESQGYCHLVDLKNPDEYQIFSNRFEASGMIFEEPSEKFFNFNNPLGACTTCNGFGSIIGIDPELVIPNQGLSLVDGAIACWKGERAKEWLEPMLKEAQKEGLSIHKPYKELSKKEKQLVWNGGVAFPGIHAFFRYIESKAYKIQNRVLLSRYRGRTKCTDCKGARIRKDASYVLINDTPIHDIVQMSIGKMIQFFDSISLGSYEKDVAKRILEEITHRLRILERVGLSYLTLNRILHTLSGGEAQRIKLARSLGSNLTQTLYILDEPSIGLHPRDTTDLIRVLKSLRDMGNTVLVVEHDEDIIREADFLIDVGPEAGTFGGEIMYSGTMPPPADVDTLTTSYLRGEREISVPKQRRKKMSRIDVKGASHFNLKSIDVSIPLHQLVAITGVSGSGKSTLIKRILYPALVREIDGFGEKPGSFSSLSGDISAIKRVEMIDQQPLGKSSRSNPVTYIKAYDAIRTLYSKLPKAQAEGYKPKAFSFNVDGGRCDECKGDGFQIVEMQFLADVRLECESCKGQRFKDEILEITYKGKSIYDVLSMTVDEAMAFFTSNAEIRNRLKPLQDVGLGYVQLGQSSSTLSGGEAQRVKLASFLVRGQEKDPILFFFDEPTTGLHFHDVAKLLAAFEALIEKGHSVVVIEHNLDIIKSSDYLIELGPVGGDDGGYLMYQGSPEGIENVKESPTRPHLLAKLGL